MKIPRIFICIVLLITLLANTFQVNASSTIYDANHRPLTIMFDESHGQIYNSTSGLYNSAISALQNLPKVSVVFNNESLSETLLAGVDVLIVTNPAENSQFQESGGIFEINAIEKYLTSGKGIFLLSNPINEDINKEGRPNVFNNLLGDTGLGVEGPLSFWESNGEPDLVVSDFDQVEEKNQTLYEINTTHYILNDQTSLKFGEELELSDFTVNKVLSSAQSLGLRIDFPLITAGIENYALRKSGTSHLEEEDPIIFGYSIYREIGRIALCGSTSMFSDEYTRYTINNEPYNTTWFDAFDNENLWIRSILWLADLFPFNEYVKPDSDINDLVLYGIIVVISGAALICGAVLISIGRTEPIKAIEEIMENLPRKKPEKVDKPTRKKPHRHKRKRK